MKSLKTFDSTGAIQTFVGGVTGRATPHFNEMGPLVIVRNCAFFQMFVIDPRGLVPNETEQTELKIMYAPFLSMSHHDEDTHRRIIEQAYSGDGRDTTSQSRDPITESPSFTEIERRTVIHAHKNRDVCNPVIRAQSSATLQYYTGINTTLVMCLGNYLSCSLRYTGDSYANLTCTSSCILFLPGNTTCQVNQQPKQLCDPFSGPVQFLASNEYADLTVTTYNTVNHEAKVVLHLQLPPHY